MARNTDNITHRFIFSYRLRTWSFSSKIIDFLHFLPHHALHFHLEVE